MTVVGTRPATSRKFDPASMTTQPDPEPWSSTAGFGILPLLAVFGVTWAAA